MQTELNPAHTIGRASAEAELLTKHLQSVEVGQVVTYSELNTVAKIDVQEHRSQLDTARRRLLKDGIAFDAVMGVGIRRLSNDEIPEVASGAVKRSQKVAKKGLRVLACADYAKLPPDLKIQHTVTGTILGIMSKSGERRVLGLAEQAARTSDSATLKIGNIASLFSK
jgi:hypothetical protein